jgi:hypothetical protein
MSRESKMETPMDLSEVLSYAIDVSQYHKNMEWSVGCSLHDDSKWFTQIRKGHHVLECLRDVDSGETYKDSIQIYTQHSLGKIRNMYFKAKIKGDDHVLLFEKVTNTIYNVLLHMSHTYGFEVEFQCRYKER